MSLYQAACSPSKIGLGGKHSTTLPKGDVRTKQDFADNQVIIRQMGQAQLNGDWTRYAVLQQQLKHST